MLGLLALSVGANAQSWTDQATNFSANYGVAIISPVDANTVWIAPYDGTGANPPAYPKVFAKTTNGGATWTATNITGLTAQANVMISDLFAIDANTAWIVTAPTTGTAGNGIYKTTNGGTSWTQQTAYSTASFANQIYFWDANNGWSAGDPVGGAFQMYKTSNGGTTWTAVSGTPAAISSNEYGYNQRCKYVIGDNIWIGTSSGRLLHSTDRGSTWTAAFTPVLDFGGNVTTGSSGLFTFRDGNNGLLISIDGLTAYGDIPSVAMYSSSDGGANWDTMDPTGLWYFGDVTYVPGTPNTYVTTGVYALDPSYMGSAYSSDGGNTWTSIDDGVQRYAVGFIDSSTGWAGTFSDGPGGTTGIVKLQGTLGVSDISSVKTNLKVYPNPAVDVVNLTAAKNIKGGTIFDASGKKVMTYTGSEINVSSLAKGTYILQVYYGGGAVENTKLIKQ